jgi:hypothetical protein
MDHHAASGYDMDQLRALLSDRAEIKDEIAQLQAELARIETAIGEIIAPLDGPVRVPGIGSVVLSKPAVSTSFDPAALRELIQSLRETGNTELADEIAACTRTTMRAGSLRVTPERPPQ